MRRLGSLVLSGLLLGIPRALESPAFGTQRSVYVQIEARSPELQAFARALERELGLGAWRLVSSRRQATTVVDVLDLVRTDGVDAIRVAVRDGQRVRRLLLQGASPSASARRLLERLTPPES